MSRKPRKLAIMGFRAVGKSTITIRFVENRFEDDYNPTIENTYSKAFKHSGNTYQCEIIDTSGQDEFSIFQSQYAIGIHGYVLVYSVNNRQSFEMVKIINDKILNAVGSDKLPRVLVGNKCDLEDRVVSREEGAALAEKWGVPFVECSAKLNKNIATVFEDLLEEVERETAPAVEKSSGCTMF